MSFYTLLTAIGAADFINAQAGGTTVPFTHLALGNGNGAAITPLESMTALVHEVHRVPISSVTADAGNPNWLVIEAVVPTTVGGWTVREIGLIGGSGAGSKLLAVGNFPDTYKPLLVEGSGRDLIVRMIIQVGNASVVQLTVDPSVALATNQSIANAIAAHEAKADPHPQYIKTSQKGVANGVATLGNDGLVPFSQLPTEIATDIELAMALAAHVGAVDPHPTYLTQNEGDARYALKVGNLWLNAAIITNAGDWIVPGDVSKIRAYAIGMGAPGTAGANGLQNLTTGGGYGGAGGNGGAGGGCAWGDIPVTPGQLIPVTINSISTLFGTYLTATAGVGRTAPGTGTIGAGVTNSGTATGGQGGLGAAAGASNQSYPLSGGGGGGGASGSPLGTGKNGATGGVNSHPTYQTSKYIGAGGWNTAGSGAANGNATAIYRGAFQQYSDSLLKPCASIVTGEDGAPGGYGGGGSWMGGGGMGGNSTAAGGSNYCTGYVGIVGGYGGGGGGGSGASMDGSNSGAAKTGLAGGPAGPGCVVVFW